MTGLLQDTDLSFEQRRLVDTVKSSGEALLSLINDILDFSKIEAGKMELDLIDFELRGLIDDVAGTLALRAHEKQLELAASADVDVPDGLRGDPGRLRQILLNLVGNALKFTSQGKVVLRVGVQSETTQSVMLRFEIHDTGIGIAADQMSALFRSFSQVDTSTTRKFGGTGLGLAISRQLSEMMGGKIGVESHPDQGSVFWFTAEFGKPGEALVEPKKSLGARSRILVVDSKLASSEAVVRQLAYLGVDAACANSVDSALEILSQVNEHPFEAILVDFEMGSLGIEFVRLARTKSAEPLLVLGMVAMNTPVDPEWKNEGVLQGVLTRPVRFRDLKTILASPRSALSYLKVESVKDAVKKDDNHSEKRILVAEDNPVNQLLIRMLLSKMGYESEIVGDGAQAIHALENREFDLVLMDCQMPVLNGYEATRMIRAIDTLVKNPKIPVIALTANAMAEDRQECMAAGMNDHIGKPIDPELLRERLEHWLFVTVV